MLRLFAHVTFKQNLRVQENASEVQRVIKMNKALQTTTGFFCTFYCLHLLNTHVVYRKTNTSDF